MTKSLKVVVDATALSGVAAGSGIGTYTRNLLGALADRTDVATHALCDNIAELPGGVERLPVTRLTKRLLPGRARAELIEHSVRLPVELRLLRPDAAVFHNPSYHAPAGIRAPWVQTLLDVIPLVFDAPDQAVLRARWKRFGPRYRRADAIVAISRHAAHEGTRVLGLDPDRIHVAPLGVDPRFSCGPHEHNGPPYLLIVSEYSQRKGFAEAFTVADNLADAGYPHRLVVAGRVHSWGADEFARLHASARHPERIEIRGYVDDLVGLYRGASCYLMSSRYEGFGLPALEAMACGVPVVAFDNSAVTEVVTGGGQLVPDGDVRAMTAAVRGVLDDPAHATEWVERGVGHARKYTWAAAAKIHKAAYDDALARVAGR